MNLDKALKSLEFYTKNRVGKKHLTAEQIWKEWIRSNYEPTKDRTN